ncbi:putative Zinc finger/thioredoxin domain-containing protein [Candidatus Magnetomoraceae bacterium gMMP-15]
MSENEQKTFKVFCAICGKPFHVRFPLADSEAEGSGEVSITCGYCNNTVMVEIPKQYIADEHLIRGIKSISPER